MERVGSGTVVILCGGRGTRLQAEAPSIPKPLVEVGGRPILWHVIQIFAAQGSTRFVLCLGHRGDQIRSFVTGCDWPQGVSVECVETGEDTPTGGRIKLVEAHLPRETFFATYADGVADVDVAALREHHLRHGRLATVTVVRPRLQFGVADLDGDDEIRGFHEKPRSEHWINGGFLCLEPGVFGYLREDSVLEREPFEALAADGQLRAYRHAGFWECLDTYKDAVSLNDLWARGPAPWKLWR